MEQYDELNMSELTFEKNRLTPGKQQDFLANFVKLTEEDGYVIVRLLPPKKGQKLYCATRTHKMNNRNIHCPRVLEQSSNRWKGDCSVCDYYNYLWRQVDDLTKRGQMADAAEMRQKARSIKPVERYYYNCIVRKSNPNVGQSPKNGPLILSIGKQLHTRIVKAIVGDEELELEPLGNVTHPTSGRDFKIIKKIVLSDGQRFPNYNESVFMNPSLLGTEEEIDEYLEKLHDIMSLRKLMQKEDLQREIRIFEKVEEDPRFSFDTRILEGPAVSGQPTIVRERIANSNKPVAVASPSDQTAVDVSDDLADDDFIKEIRQMG